MTVDVAVIGGGISGLSVAFGLAALGHGVIVLERQATVGGKALSENIGGFLMEHGPSSIGTEAKSAPLLQALGLDSARVELGPSVRRRYLVKNGALHGIPLHPAAFVIGGFLSARGRLRLLAEIMAPRRSSGDDESVASFCRRRFGPEFTDGVMDPLVAGMFAGDIASVSVGAIFPRLVEMEKTHGSVLRAVILGRLLGKSMPGRRIFSWHDGVGALPGALAQRLGSAVKTGVAVRRIVTRGGGFRIDTNTSGAVDTKAVVIATQPHVTAALLDGLNADAAVAAARIDAPPIAVVFGGYARGQVAHPLDGLGFLAPSGERRVLNGALFCSSMFRRRAPEGFVSIAGYAGGARNPELARLPAAELIELAHREFVQLLGVKGRPVLARVRHWPRGLPQYRVGHHGLLSRLTEAIGRTPGLFVAGNYFAGVSVAACISKAAQTAAQVDTFLRAQARDAFVATSTQTVEGDGVRLSLHRSC